MLSLGSFRFELLNGVPIDERYFIYNSAAAYGKAFLPPNMVSNNDIYETTKLLRICNQLRSKLMRFITY